MRDDVEKLIKQREASRRYYWKNKEKINARLRTYYKTDEFKKWRKENRHKYREAENKIAKEYYQKNKIEIQIKQGTRGKAIRTAIRKLLGDKCNTCGFNDVRALQIDHVNGGGNKLRKQYGEMVHNRMILESLINGSKDYQLLCANCNWIKRHTNKEIKYYDK